MSYEAKKSDVVDDMSEELKEYSKWVRVSHSDSDLKDLKVNPERDLFSPVLGVDSSESDSVSSVYSIAVTQ